jgi:L-ascorbate metabolism protein UlaG (beta-lactamase superfamily)
MPPSQNALQPPVIHPSLQPYRQYIQQPSTDGPIDVRFLGTTSLLFRDGETAILSDGFVTRPGKVKSILGRIAPDRKIIRHTMEELGITSLDAVFCGHSHYDHSMDAPVFADLTGAMLLGSASTANVGRGVRLPESKLKVVEAGQTLRFGKFELTFIESVHSRPHLHQGHVTAPLVPPKWQGAWKTGETYSVEIRHNGRAILLHGSANYEPGALRDVRAEVVYLGIGSLGKQKDDFVDAYWEEVVGGPRARRVILVHWDDFFRGLDQPLRPMPFPVDRVGPGIRHILRRAEAARVEVLLPVPWQPTNPFAGLD